MFYIIVFVVINVIIGILITFLSGSKHPYKPKMNETTEFEEYEDVEIEIEEESENEILESVVPINDEDKVNQMAEKLIPSPSDFQIPQEKAAKEMEEKVKGYFDDNPKEATKIFKTMLKKDK